MERRNSFILMKHTFQAIVKSFPNNAQPLDPSIGERLCNCFISIQEFHVHCPIETWRGHSTLSKKGSASNRKLFSYPMRSDYIMPSTNSTCYLTSEARPSFCTRTSFGSPGHCMACGHPMPSEKSENGILLLFLPGWSFNTSSLPTHSPGTLCFVHRNFQLKHCAHMVHKAVSSPVGLVCLALVLLLRSIFNKRWLLKVTCSNAIYGHSSSFLLH